MLDLINLQVLIGVFFLSLFTEGTIEYFLAVPLKNSGKPTWWLQYAALIPAVGLSIAYGMDLPGMLGMTAPVPFVGEIVSGVIISRGANYTSDFLGRLAGLAGSWMKKKAE